MSDVMTTPALIGLKEIAELAGLSYECVRRMASEGLLPEAHLPKPYRARWRRCDVLAWLGVQEGQS